MTISAVYTAFIVLFWNGEIIVEVLWLFLLMVLGIAMLCKPQLLWKVENIFTVKDGEPTKLYIYLMRVGGIFFVVTGSIILIGILI